MLVCVVCQEEFPFQRLAGGGTRAPKKTCSLPCRDKLFGQSTRANLQDHPCPDCGAIVFGYHTRRCDGCRARRRREHYRRKNSVRRGAAVNGAVMPLAELGERDGWRCHLCRRKVDAGLHYLHPMAPTKDHLIPIAAGGVDDPANLALAHRRCNTSRGTGGSVQLALIG